ncbi:peptidase inhibitor family I36 [Stackebrandtia endophytica]|uniref:Peptidase inhibitor family I36 n=1 Tax=Stackebrandtia endophytica TaxID=1496996 RepID=A0A543AQ08_9ACTN|nr:peptidase inhibitor family I36 protein [Stackebrandtia endophytica]TQL74667.1 peptidase inhibitor family I36 [Stackebrandtia endophytica]
MRIRTVLITGVTGALLGLSSIAPAGAVVTDSTGGPVAESEVCPQGWFCGFQQPSYQGEWVGGADSYICYTPLNDAQSVANRTGHTIRFFSQPHCQGEYFDLTTGYGMTHTPFAVASTSTAWY